MKNLLCVLILFLCLNMCSFADEIQDIQCFFNKYVNAANTYSCDYFDYYTFDHRLCGRFVCSVPSW